MTEPQTVTFRPQAGPQEQFMASPADIVVYGGAAYGGKTAGVLLWMLSLCLHSRVSCIVFRREFPRLIGGGSIWEQSEKFFSGFGATHTLNPRVWTFPNGSTVEFSHMQHEKDRTTHQGKRYTCVIFEEATEFTESQFWFLFGRLESTPRVRRHARLTCNPDPDSFVRGMIDWWIGPDGFPIKSRSGVLRWAVRDRDGKLVWFDSRAEAEASGIEADDPISITFIPALVTDNKMGDPRYKGTLQALPLVDRARMLGGNWDIRPQAGTVLRREWFRIVDGPPGPILRSVRGWDKGASVGGDWTRGAKLCDLGEGAGWYLADMVSVRDTPGGVFRAMRAAAELDGLTTPIAIWQDPGQAGIVDVETTRAQLRGYAVHAHRATESKLAYATPWATAAEHGSRGTGPAFYVQRAPWNEAFFAEVDGFPTGANDDQVDAVSCAWQSLSAPVDDGFHRPPPMERKMGLY